MELIVLNGWVVTIIEDMVLSSFTRKRKEPTDSLTNYTKDQFHLEMVITELAFSMPVTIVNA